MRTLSKIPVEVQFVDEMPDFADFADNVIYVSEKYGVSCHKCLCGCGEKSVVPFKKTQQEVDSSIAPKTFWVLNVVDGKITITPSILNPCFGHYIISDGIANIVGRKPDN